MDVSLKSKCWMCGFVTKFFSYWSMAVGWSLSKLLPPIIKLESSQFLYCVLANVKKVSSSLEVKRL